MPWGHNFDRSGSSLTGQVRRTIAHIPWKFQVSPTNSSIGSCGTIFFNYWLTHFSENQNFDPPNFPTPLYFSGSKGLVTPHPYNKFGVNRSKGFGARRHKAEKRNRALRAQFWPDWVVTYMARVSHLGAPTLKVSCLCDFPFEDLVLPVWFC